MDIGTNTTVWKILLTLGLIGAFLGFWFSESSKFSLGSLLNMPYRSVLPVSCSLSIDRTEESREYAEAYFWHGNVRLDVHSITPTRTQHVHEIVTPSGNSYVWQEGSSYGDVSETAFQYNDIAGAETSKEWFCYPWFLIDFSLFDAPPDIQFE